jgi:nucleoside-diphosphate-sugar epimerase
VSGEVLVTGGAGFVGSHVVDALLARGERVRVLVRPTTDRAFLAGRDVRLVDGDVGDESKAGAEALARAVEGAGLVVHAAGITQARRVEDFARVNTRGTERVVGAAAAAGVPRLVFVSSQAAGGPSPEGRARSESDPDSPVSAYGVSKKAAEEAACAAVAAAGGRTSLVVIRPPAVYGPRDRAFLELFRLVRRGVVPLHRADRQWVSLIHAVDLAKAIVAAAERGGAGSTYYVTDGTPRTSASIVDAICQALGCRPWRLDLPEGALRAVVGLAESWAAWTGRPARLTRERLAEWTAPRWTLADEKARRELGFTPDVPFRQGIEETAAWYRNAGWI